MAPRDRTTDSTPVLTGWEDAIRNGLTSRIGVGSASPVARYVSPRMQERMRRATEKIRNLTKDGQVRELVERGRVIRALKAGPMRSGQQNRIAAAFAAMMMGGG